MESTRLCALTKVGTREMSALSSAMESYAQAARTQLMDVPLAMAPHANLAGGISITVVPRVVEVLG